MDAPYLRIADELRRRIAAGELAPGDRLPSTRRIAADWNVAPATAAKALTWLQQLGLARAEPRIGNVVVGPEEKPTSEREVTRDRVVRAAVEIADGEGLSAVSMRAVAARLDVATMTLYGHVAGKDDLVLLMADAAYGEVAFPRRPPAHWRSRLEIGVRILWTVHRRHPWLGQLSPLTRPLVLPNLATHGDWILGCLDGLGLPVETRMDLEVLIFAFVQGLATNLEREAQASAATGLTDEQWIDRQAPKLDAIATGHRHPAFGKVLRELGDSGGYDLDLDRLFGLGLQAILDHIEKSASHNRRL